MSCAGNSASIWKYENIPTKSLNSSVWLVNKYLHAPAILVCMTAVVQQSSHCLQDPTRRPTAQGLLQHDFLQHVQAPASLQHTISAHAAKRPPLDQLNHQATEHQQTMPRWNFGTEQAPPGAQPQAKKAGTLRSHQINMTWHDDGTVRHHTVAEHPSLAMMAQLAEAGLVSSKAA